MMDTRPFAAPKGLRPRRRVKPAYDAVFGLVPRTQRSAQHLPLSRGPGHLTKLGPGSAKQREERCIAPGTRDLTAGISPA
jgi:hypothetical protein